MNLPSVEAPQEGDRPRLPFRERRIFSPSLRRASGTLTLLFSLLFLPGSKFVREGFRKRQVSEAWSHVASPEENFFLLPRLPVKERGGMRGESLEEARWRIMNRELFVIHYPSFTEESVFIRSSRGSLSSFASVPFRFKLSIFNSQFSTDESSGRRLLEIRARGA